MSDLTRSPCLGISDYATILLQFIFVHARRYENMITKYITLLNNTIVLELLGNFKKSLFRVVSLFG